MPYASNSELPPEIQNNLPEAAQTVYRKAYNSANATNDTQESSAIAWAAVEKAGFKKVDDRWIKTRKADMNEFANLLSKMGQAYIESQEQPETTNVNKSLEEGVVLEKDEELGVVWGWFNVSKVNGEAFFDTEESHVSERELQKAAHNFLMKARSPGGEMHKRYSDDSVYEVGSIVDSIVFTKQLQKMLGIDLGRVGWFGGIKIDKENYPEVWNKIKVGEYTAFSLGGTSKARMVEGGVS